MERHYLRSLWDIIGIIVLGGVFFIPSWELPSLILYAWICIYFFTFRLTGMQTIVVMGSIFLSFILGNYIYNTANIIEYVDLFFLINTLLLLYFLKKEAVNGKILMMCTQFVVLAYFVIHIIFPSVNITDVYLIAPIVSFSINDLKMYVKKS